MNRPRRCLLVLALIPLAALLILLTACSPCQSALAPGCEPFPMADARQ